MPVPITSARRALASLLCLALALSTALVLAGCGQDASEVATDSITQGIADDVAKLRKLDADTVSDLFSSDFTDQLEDAGIDPSVVYAPLFEKLSVTVEGIDVSDDETTAVAHLSITNRDLATAFANYQSALTDDLSASDNADTFVAMASDDAALLSYLTDELAKAVEDTDVSTVTTKVDVTYTLSDGSWVVGDATDLTALRKALLGGLDAAELEASAEAEAAEVASTEAAQATVETTETSGATEAEQSAA